MVQVVNCSSEPNALLPQPHVEHVQSADWKWVGDGDGDVTEMAMAMTIPLQLSFVVVRAFLARPSQLHLSVVALLAPAPVRTQTHTHTHIASLKHTAIIVKTTMRIPWLDHAQVLLDIHGPVVREAFFPL